MFRTIPSRRLLFALRFFNSNGRRYSRTSLLKSHKKPSPIQFYHPPSVLISKSLFSTTQSCSLSEAEKKAKLGEERRNALKQKLEADPENVTSTSSLTPIFDPKPGPSAATNNEGNNDPDMLRGLKSDLKVVKETFELNEVPKEVLYIGMGGLIPYLTTSLSTLYLSWDINYSAEHGIGYLVSGETAGHLLHILEPLQIGFGAIILSFLGAVHWGLEMAEYGGRHTYKRYSLAILAPMIAWPTLLLPIDYALLAQFVGFTGMYFADSIATTKGWAPKWYMTYRFLLTFVVGASVVVTLVGRGQIGDRISKIPGPASYLQDLRDSQWENLRKEEEERRRSLRKEEKEVKEAENEQAAGVEDKEEGGGGDKDPGEAEKENQEKSNKKDKTNGDRAAADPGKRAKGDKPGTQGVYSDDKQSSGESKSKNTSPGESPEPSGEKKVVQKPKPEVNENSSGVAKARG